MRENIFGENRFLIFPVHSVDIAEILSHTFLQKFRENNGFTKEITKYIVDLTKNFIEREFLVFPQCGVEIMEF